MADYRICLRLRSALGTPLQGDTMFGHLCWAWRATRGESWLAEFLAAYGDERAPLVLSDGFPAGWLPFPSLPQPRLGAAADPAAAEAAKALRAVRLVRQEWLLEAASAGLQDALRSLAEEGARDPERLRENVRGGPPGRVRATPHVTIDRRSGAVRRPGGLYAQPDYLPDDEGRDWVMFARVADDAPGLVEALGEALAVVGRQGYGRDASAGLGRVEASLEPWQWPAAPQDADAFMALSAFVPRAGDPVEGWWSLRAKFGKLGGWWATGPGPDGRHDPFKRPLLMVDAGAVFRTGRERRPWYGQLLGGVHRDSRIRHHALCLPLEVRL
jgi:CRISPR-associated protein Csm4